PYDTPAPRLKSWSKIYPFYSNLNLYNQWLQTEHLNDNSLGYWVSDHFEELVKTASSNETSRMQQLEGFYQIPQTQLQQSLSPDLVLPVSLVSAFTLFLNYLIKDQVVVIFDILQNSAILYDPVQIQTKIFQDLFEQVHSVTYRTMNLEFHVA